MVEDIGSALLAKDVFVYFELFVLEADIELDMLVIEWKIVGKPLRLLFLLFYKAPVYN